MGSWRLWDYALALYRRPGVEAACLSLQDEAGADIPFVLFLLWCAAEGRGLEAQAITEADAGIAAFRDEVIRPLRSARRAMKRELLVGLDTEPLRSDVKATELAAERLALEALERRAPAPGGEVDRALAARTNLSVYAAGLGVALPQGPAEVLFGAFDGP